LKNIHFTKTIVLLLNFLVSCRAETPPATGSPTVTAARIPSPTPTPDPEIISPENANQLVLRMMNMGTAVGDPKYSMDRK
jgi:hypothetical protein